MSPNRVVAIVDAYSTARYFAPLFHARGYRCVHVQSAPSVPAVYAATFHPDDFGDHVVHRGELSDTVGALARLRPDAVIAGIESGVELADRLSEAMGLRTNGTARSEPRRDKFRMVEQIKAAGLPGAAQLLATDRDELAAWYAASGAGQVVVKPVKSAGNDGVHFCDDEAGVLAALDALIGTDSALDLRNNAVVAQEYLLGVEYYVNTVSLDGVHYVTDVHSTRHLNVNGVRDLLGGSHLLPRRGPEQDQLVEYVSAVLDALGIRNGPAHTEVKLTEDGPRLIETASRICGADLPVLVDAAIGASQLAWTVDAYTDPTGFAERAKEDYRVREHAICVNMVSPRAGTLRAYPKLDELSALPSFHGTLTRVRPGDRIHRTVNDFTYPMLVHLLHPSRAVLLRDYATARYLDGDGFYEVD
ncbi:ATP-grasp domain-containing protein [Streptomyces sp. NBC_00223]|uniref:ATP-grasp domain-containing protein n=1 Tax=Streptomyces sp. NBC_00223 TaxID=2976008 RepID=UPI002E27BBA6|nr:ATP-grasp domain-containing protein [Streptomyces sp. NBC_00223]